MATQPNNHPRQLTLAESFFAPLPSLTRKSIKLRADGLAYRDINAAASTNLVDSPRALEENEATILFDEVRWNISPNAPLSYYLPVPEVFNLINEADVRRAADLYLLHPVNKALERDTPEGWKIVCNAEVPFGRNSRTDIVWTVFDHRNHSKILAVLEFKSTYTLHFADFAPALASTDPKAPPDRRPAAMMSKQFREDQPDNTFLRDNAVIVAKQVKKYHQASRCNDVAFFD